MLTSDDPRRHEEPTWLVHIPPADSFLPTFLWGLSNFHEHISAIALPKLVSVLLVLVARLFLLTVVLGRVVVPGLLPLPFSGLPMHPPFPTVPFLQP